VIIIELILSLCLQAVRECEGIVPRILCLGTRWRWEVNYAAAIPSPARTIRYTFGRRLAGS